MAALVGGSRQSKNIYNFSKNCIKWRALRHFSSSVNDISFQSAPSSEVVIPAYIPRGPTEILEALASTVKCDPTAARFQYHDDPFFIPASDFDKKQAGLSKDSGKRTASYFIENFPEGFKHDEAAPKILDYNAPIQVTDETVVSEEMLYAFVRTCQVDNAFKAYQKLKNQGVNIQHDIVSELLELLCYYNSTDPASDTYGYEKYYIRQGEAGNVQYTWKDSGPAEMVFNELEIKEGRNYRALIQGMSKYSKGEAADRLYLEMMEKGFRGSTKMYNALLRCVPWIQTRSFARWDKAESYLKAMAVDGLEPDVQTFNNLLKLLTSTGKWPKIKTKVTNVLAEMKSVGIEPSLVTYNHILDLSYFEGSEGPKSTILYDIMKVVEGKVFELTEPSQFSFFKSAMRACNKHLQDLDLAYKVHDMLCLGSNKIIFENFVEENTYYINFLNVVCSFESLDKIISFYEQLVPSKVTPNSTLMKTILTTMENSEEVENLPRMWSDICLYQLTRKEGILEIALSLVAKTIEKQSLDIQNKLMVIVCNITELIQEEDADHSSKAPEIKLTQSMLGNMLTACVVVKDLEKAWEIASLLLQGKTVLGVFPVSPLLCFCRFALDSDQVEIALACLDHAFELGVETSELVEILHKFAHKIPTKYSVKFKGLEKIDF